MDFDLGVGEGIDVPIWIYVVFQQSDRQHDQNLKDDTFCRMPVTSAQCIIGTEKNTDSGILLNYNDDDYSQGYGQTKEAFRALTKVNILQLYKKEVEYRSSTNGNEIGYNIHVFDVRYQKNIDNGQSVKLEFNLMVLFLLGYTVTL